MLILDVNLDRLKESSKFNILTYLLYLFLWMNSVALIYYLVTIGLTTLLGFFKMGPVLLQGGSDKTNYKWSYI